MPLSSSKRQTNLLLKKFCCARTPATPADHGFFDSADCTGLTLVGSGALTASNAADAHSPYAEEIRRKLAESTDDRLLTATGIFLVQARELHLDFDYVALGKSYLERAVQIKPQTIEANRALFGVESGKVWQRIREVLADVPKEAKPKVVSALPEAERFQALPMLAEYASGEGDSLTGLDLTAAKAAWERARNYAQDLLELAPKFHDHPHYGTAVFRGNVVLGHVAIRNGDKTGAVKYLRQASRSTGSRELAYSSSIIWRRLCSALLRSGVREPVAEFLERFASQLSVSEKDRLLESAAAIRKGRRTL